MWGGGRGIFNNRLSFSLLFSGNFFFWGGEKAVMEGDKIVIGGSSPLGKTLTGMNKNESKNS